MSPLDQISTPTDDLNSETDLDPVLRRILGECGGIAEATSLTDATDLFAAGLESFGMVNVMLEIEEFCRIRFQADQLTRRSFASLGALKLAIRTACSAAW